MAKKSATDINKINEVVNRLRDQAFIETEILDIEGKINNQLSNIFKNKQKILDLTQDQITYDKIINELKNRSNIYSHEEQDILLDHARSLKNNIKHHRKIETSLKTQTNFLSEIGRGLKDIATTSFSYLMNADKAIKSTALSLGISGQRSDTLRENFNLSAGYAATLGARVSDLAAIQTEYTNQTGRATLLNQENLKAIVDIGKGTSMGIESAARMAGNFEILGYNAGQTRDLIQNIVDTSERFGVNTAKVLENITENFQRAQRFRFKDGVESLARMAQDAAKFKIDMNSVIDSAEKARTLEGAVEMAARLQVMGGGFSQMGDAFTLLFQSRNDLEAYQKTLNSMLGDIATFNKRTGEFEVSALNLDRLRHVAEATGESFDDLVTRSRRLGEIQRMQPFLAGLAPEDRELVENMAQMSKTGGFTLQVGREVRALSDVTPDFVEMLRQERKTLEERAKAAQTFDEVYANTIEELKTLLLPLLKEINWVLGKARQAIDGFREFAKPLSDLIQDNSLLRAGILISGAVAGLSGLKFLRTLPKIIGGLMKIPKLSGAGGGGGFLGLPSQQGIAGYSKGLLSFGAAILAVGGGIKLAVDGISNLADSFEKLPIEKIEAVKNISYALIGGFAGITIALAALSPLIAKAGLAMLPFGASIGLIGAGIGVAAAGIGYMVDHLSKLGNQDIATNLMETSAGIMSIAGASMMMANPATILGLAALTSALFAINKIGTGSGMENLSNTFKSVAAILDGDMQNLKQLKETIKEIKGLNASNNNPLSDLKEMFSKPLKVQFDEKEVNLVVNLDAYMDGERVAENRNFRKAMAVRFGQTSKGYS
ncbi:MAG: hypothetical protein ACOC33_00065 [bacterium]